MITLRILLLCLLAISSHHVTLSEQQNSLSLSLKKAIYKSMYDLHEPSLQTQLVLDKAVANMGLPPIEALEYSAEATASPMLGKFMLMVPNFDQLTGPARAYELFNVYRELNRLVDNNSRFIIRTFVSILYALISLPLALPPIHPYFALDLQLAYRLLGDGYLKQGITRGAPSILLAALWLSSVTAVWSALIKFLMDNKEHQESYLDVLAAKSLLANEPHVFEEVIEYIETHDTSHRACARVALLRLRQTMNLPYWRLMDKVNKSACQPTLE